MRTCPARPGSAGAEEIRRLEADLAAALEHSTRAIASRLRLHEQKQALLAELRDALRTMASLEGQLKTLSASTLSVSSSSSLGSLSTTSSKVRSLLFSFFIFYCQIKILTRSIIHLFFAGLSK